LFHFYLFALWYFYLVALVKKYNNQHNFKQIKMQSLRKMPESAIATALWCFKVQVEGKEYHYINMAHAIMDNKINMTHPHEIWNRMCGLTTANDGLIFTRISYKEYAERCGPITVVQRNFFCACGGYCKVQKTNLNSHLRSAGHNSWATERAKKAGSLVPIVNDVIMAEITRQVRVENDTAEVLLSLGEVQEVQKKKRTFDL